MQEMGTPLPSTFSHMLTAYAQLTDIYFRNFFYISVISSEFDLFVPYTQYCICILCYVRTWKTPSM